MTAYMPTFICRNITGIRPTHDFEITDKVKIQGDIFKLLWPS
jgi:hypothetical protein